MTLTERAILDFYQTPEEREQDASRYTVAHPNDPQDLINRIQRGAYIASLD
jgi:hypothetical protein